MTGPRDVAVFGSSETPPGTAGWDEAEMVGRTLAKAGFGVVTGGYGGTMEAASKGAHSAGGRTVGVTAPSLFPDRSEANRYVTELVEATTLTGRIGIMMERASGVMALAGSIGTATELLIAWNHNHLARRNGGRRIPTVAIGPVWAEIADKMINRAGAHSGDIHLEQTAAAGVTWLVEELKKR